MHPKSIQISIDHEKLGTQKVIENYPKSSKVTLKTTKKLSKCLVFKHRNMLLIAGPSQLNGFFISGPGHLGTLKIQRKLRKLVQKSY
jgi:hypothetical protein